MPPRTVKRVKKTSGLRHWMQRVLEECDHVAAGFSADPAVQPSPNPTPIPIASPSPAAAAGPASATD